MFRFNCLHSVIGRTREIDNFVIRVICLCFRCNYTFLVDCRNTKLKIQNLAHNSLRQRRELVNEWSFHRSKYELLGHVWQSIIVIINCSWNKTKLWKLSKRFNLSMKLTNRHERFTNKVNEDTVLVELFKFLQSKNDVKYGRLFKRLFNFLLSGWSETVTLISLITVKLFF